MKSWKSIVGIVALAAIAGVGYVRWAARPLTVPELIAMYKLPNSQFVDVDGAQVHFAEDGAKDLPCVVVLNSVNTNLRNWDGVIDGLKPNFHLIRIDTLTMGLTGPDPHDDYSMGRNPRIIEVVTERLGLARCSFLTNGGGGRITYRYATAHPERVDRIVFINSAGAPHHFPPPPVPSLLDRVKGWLAPRSVVAERVRREFGAVPPSEDYIQMYYDMNRRAGLEHEIKLAKVSASGDDAEKYLPNLRAPSLLLWGKADNLTGADLPVFEKALNHAPSMTLIYEHAGHYPFIEQPQDVVRDVTAFLTGARDGELRQPAQTATAPADGTAH